jgi:neutral ceramidase
MESRRSFIKKSVVTGAALGIQQAIPLAAFGTDTNADASGKNAFETAVMRSGFAETDITPEIGMEQPGDYGKLFHETMHDACKVRAAVFDDGKKRVALVGIDALGIFKSVVEKVRREIHARCGISPDSIMIGASHSHSSGPTLMVQPGEYDDADQLVKFLAYEKSSCADAKYLAHVEKQLVEAVCEADKSLKETQVGIGKGMEDKVAFNRRFHMKNGLSYTHPGQLNPDMLEPAGPIDPEVGVIGAWNKDGKCIGCIVNYACHATTNPGGISANWIYYMEQTIRGAMGPDCVVVFLAGANGDITQVDNRNPFVNRSGEDWARFVGGRVGAEAVKTLLDMPRGILVPVDSRVMTMEMKRRVPDPLRVKQSVEVVSKPLQSGQPVTTDWIFAKEIVMLDAKIRKSPNVKVEVQAIQVGPAVFVSNPAEFFCQLGLDIKAQSNFPYTFPVELANDCVGYVPTLEAFHPNGGGYETRLTSYSNLETQAGNKMVKAGVELARQMSPGIAPEWPKVPPFKASPWTYGSVKPELK